MKPDFIPNTEQFISLPSGLDFRGVLPSYEQIWYDRYAGKGSLKKRKREFKESLQKRRQAD